MISNIDHHIISMYTQITRTIISIIKLLQLVAWIKSLIALHYLSQRIDDQFKLRYWLHWSHWITAHNISLIKWSHRWSLHCLLNMNNNERRNINMSFVWVIDENVWLSLIEEGKYSSYSTARMSELCIIVVQLLEWIIKIVTALEWLSWPTAIMEYYMEPTISFLLKILLNQSENVVHWLASQRYSSFRYITLALRP